MTTRLNYRIAQAGVAVALLGVLWATGCSSSSKKKDLPQTIESKVTATQSEPDRVSYIEVSPWSLEPGGTVQVKAGGTQGRGDRDPVGRGLPALHEVPHRLRESVP